METNLADFIRNTPEGIEADRILRACVHCGFCTATCPTYQLLGDELDGPRGRIYLIKQVLEGGPVTDKTRLHLDRCLTCRACETTCPSGVQYGRLADIGRQVVEERAEIPRPPMERFKRSALRFGLTRRWLFDPAMALGKSVRPLLTASVRSKVPRPQSAGAWPSARHPERMLMLEGCVQPAMMPNINTATARVFDAAGVEMIRPRSAGCCGALQHHLADQAGALDHMRQNINAWIAHLDAGASRIVINASGCGVMVKEYGHLLAHDPNYAEKARRVSDAAADVSEVVLELLPRLAKKLPKGDGARIAFHPPCTLQHGMKIRGVVESVLKSAGYDVRLPIDSHLCCGSAGTYSVLQPKIAEQLRDNKIEKLTACAPQCIVSANIGCISHLQNGTSTPVKHWIEIVDTLLQGSELTT